MHNRKKLYETSDEEAKPRLHPLLPAPSLCWKYVMINAKSLCSNIKKLKYLSGFLEKQKLFHDVFDFSSLDMKGKRNQR